MVLAQGGGCVRACEGVETGRRLPGVWGWLGGGLLGFMLWGGGSYDGDWRDGKMHGRGIEAYADVGR